MSSEQLTRVDEWRRNQPDIPPRAEAIRRLADEALGVRLYPRPSRPTPETKEDER